MDFKKNQIIYTQAGFAKVISVRSLNQTMQSLIKDPPRKNSKIRVQTQMESSQSTSPQTEVNQETSSDPLDFNFGEVFLLLERLASVDEMKLKVEQDGLIKVDFLQGGSGFISPKYVLISKIGQISPYSEDQAFDRRQETSFGGNSSPGQP